MVTSFQKVDVIGRHQPESEFSGELRQHLVALLLRFDPVIVHLEKKILGAENIAKLGRALPGLGEVVGLDRHVDLALETAAQADQAARVPGEELLVNPWFIMKAVEMGYGDHLDQVAIAR